MYLKSLAIHITIDERFDCHLLLLIESTKSLVVLHVEHILSANVALCVVGQIDDVVLCVTLEGGGSELLSTWFLHEELNLVGGLQSLNLHCHSALEFLSLGGIGVGLEGVTLFIDGIVGSGIYLCVCCIEDDIVQVVVTLRRPLVLEDIETNVLCCISEFVLRIRSLSRGIHWVGLECHHEVAVVVVVVVVILE